MVEADHGSDGEHAEYERISGETVGLQGRLLLADIQSLNLETPCQPDCVKTIVSFDQRVYTPYETASHAERLRTALGKQEEPFAKQKQEWIDGMTTSLNHPQNRQQQDRLSPFFRKIGIRPEDDAGQFTTDQADRLYQRYFSRDVAAGGVKRFVADVLINYQTNGTTDRTALARDLGEIQWLANMFGKQSAEMVTQLVLAEAQWLTDPTFKTAVVQQRSGDTDPTHIRINDLNQKEKSILTFIYGETKHLQQTKQQPSPQPPSEPEKPQPSPNIPLPEEEDDTEEEPQAPKEFPIMKRAEDIKAAIKANDNTIVIGKTGSGKTIKIPLMIREIMDLKKEDKLIISEPTQVSTSSLAKKIAKLNNLKFGKEVGYQHGSGKKQKVSTDTLVNTEGTLLQKLLKDPELKEATHVLVDEIHVRSDDTEEVLYYLRRAQQKRKNSGRPLKIIAASATVNKEELEGYFGTKAIEVEGFMHPVEEVFLPPNTPEIPSSKMPEEAAKKAKEIMTTTKKGDLIVFVAGVGDIQKTAELIKKQELPNTRIIELHRGSPDKDKEEVERYAKKGERRIIIATNIAETGITVQGLRYEINTGEENQEMVDATSGLRYLATKIKQSQAGCDQRRGRLGRMAPGTCYNLFTKENYDARQPYPTPEIQRSDLASLLLRMKKRGIPLAEFTIMSKLDQQRIDAAEAKLKLLGAIDSKSGAITDIGKKMLDLPVDYHSARMIVAAEIDGQGVEQMCTLAAIQEAKGLFSRDDAAIKETVARCMKKNPDLRSDFLLNLKIWNEYLENGESTEWAEKNGLDPGHITKIKETRGKLLRRINEGNADRQTITLDALDADLGKYIYAGFKDKLMEYNTTTHAYRLVRTPGDNLAITIDKRAHTTLGAMQNPPPYLIATDCNPFNRVRDKRNYLVPVSVKTCMAVDPTWIA